VGGGVLACLRLIKRSGASSQAGVTAYKLTTIAGFVWGRQVQCMYCRLKALQLPHARVNDWPALQRAQIACVCCLLRCSAKVLEMHLQACLHLGVDVWLHSAMLLHCALHMSRLQCFYANLSLGSA
jgi:hypothetical protein